MITYIMDPLKEVVSMVTGILPTVIEVLAVLVVGSLAARSTRFDPRLRSTLRVGMGRSTRLASLFRSHPR